MKCVALVQCQTRRDDGRIAPYNAGDVGEFEKCPPNFKPLAGESEDAMPIDFDKAQEQELLESEFDLDALKEYIEKKYDRKAGNRGKEKTIDMLLDCRFRSLDVDPNDMV